MPVLFKQLVAVLDSRTTFVCLKAAGQIQPLDDPFTTLNGEFDSPPFHISCRTMVAPYMTGFVNEQRTLANKELQRRPREKRDWRKGKNPPPADGNPPKGGPKTPKPSGPKPTSRSAALDIVETPRTKVTPKRAERLAKEIAERSSMHRNVIDGIRKWTGADAAEMLTETEKWKPFLDAVRSAPMTRRVLWRGISPTSAVALAQWERLRAGDVIPNRFVQSFSTKKSVAARLVGPPISAAAARHLEIDEPLAGFTGVLVEFRGQKRALPIGAVARNPADEEWLSGYDLRVVKIRKVGYEAWHVTVEQAR